MLTFFIATTPSLVPELVTLSVAVIKDRDQKQLIEGRVYLGYGSRGTDIHHGRKAQHQVAGMAVGTGNFELTSSEARTKQREWTEVRRDYTLLKPASSDVLPPARLPRLKFPQTMLLIGNQVEESFHSNHSRRSSKEVLTPSINRISPG